jgi:hypothetical protein
MTINLREQLHKTIDELPSTRLETTLRFLELLAAAPEDADVESEETWLLANGTLKHMVDEIDNAPPPIEDWRKHLHDL